MKRLPTIVKSALPSFLKSYHMIQRCLYMYCACNVNTYSELIQCPELSIDNGEVVIAPNSRLLNAKTAYKCSSGYNLQGSSERFCQANSTWNGTDPLCGKCYLNDFVEKTTWLLCSLEPVRLLPCIIFLLLVYKLGESLVRG